MKNFIIKVLTPISIVYPYGTGRIGKLSIFGIPIYRAEFPEWDANLWKKRYAGQPDSSVAAADLTSEGRKKIMEQVQGALQKP